MEKIVDFVIAAIPFIIIGVCVEVICANREKMKSHNAARGMGIGMCFGTAVGLAVAEIAHIPQGLGVSCGLLIGETIGMFASLRSDDKDDA